MLRCCREDFFIPEPNATNSFRVLARYVESPNVGKIAVVLCKKEKGMAILSAPHWEFNSEDLNGLENVFPHLNMEKRRQNLRTGDNFRKECLSQMFRELME